MSKLLSAAWTAVSSRFVPPAVVGIFLVLYIAIAFVTDEALITLIAVTQKSYLLVVLFAVIPINMIIRLVEDARRHVELRNLTAGKGAELRDEIFDEVVRLQGVDLSTELADRLASCGYRTRTGETELAAWRGFSLFPGRLVFRAGIVLLFAGIAISLGGRTSVRGAVIEGEPMPAEGRTRGVVDRIVLRDAHGQLLKKDLLLEVVSESNEKKVFRLYPPGRYNGAYVYPRYLGLGVKVHVTAPDLPERFEQHAVLNIYPPGKEDAVEIPGSAYRLIISLAPPEDGRDPYETGVMTFFFRLLKGDNVVATSTLASGGEYIRDGYGISFPDSRRLVITDFIRDNGVPLIWLAAVLFLVASAMWVPTRLFFPRREMLFSWGAERVTACSRAEGKGFRHSALFHDSLDFLEARRVKQGVTLLSRETPGSGVLPSDN